MRYLHLLVSVLALSLVVEFNDTHWASSIYANPQRNHPFYGITPSMGQTSMDWEPHLFPNATCDITFLQTVAFQTADELESLTEELRRLKKQRPKTASEFRAQHRAIRTIAAASLRKIVDSTSDNYLEIERDWILSSTLLVPPVGDSPPSQAGEDVMSVDAILESWRKYVERRKALDLADLRLISQIAKHIEATCNSSESIRCYEFFLNTISEASNSTDVGVRIKGGSEGSYKQLEIIFAGAVRRLQLIGAPLKLSGRTFDGQDFQIESYRGKVVLVDYWATWCGPCVAEYPQIRELWEKYNAAGFEVVGVSMDDDRSSLAKYIKEKSVPWVILNDEEQGGKHPSTEYYNIQTVPAMFLIGRDGNVITTKVEVSKLEALLREALSKQ
jgi:peroxiredoxin